MGKIQNQTCLSISYIVKFLDGNKQINNPLLGCQEASAAYLISEGLPIVNISHLQLRSILWAPESGPHEC